jgi:hypothetical protein
MNRFTWIIALTAALGMTSALFAQNLVPNGDFEEIQRDEADAPILDAYGYQAPSGWFRSITDPGTHSTPLTELINPANMNNAAGDNAGDDSDGDGVSSLALNFVEEASTAPFGAGADWRSEAFETVPGETLFFSIDVKFLGVSQEEISGSGLFEGIFAQVRSFDQLAPDGGTAGSHKGELNVTLQSRDFTPSQWTTVTSSFVVPADGFFTDVRVSTNLFIPPSPLLAGQVLFDKLTINRLTADFDDDGNVDGDDLTVWTENIGPTAAADANADGVTDGADFLAWQREFGLGITPPVGAAIAAVPEPGSAVLAAMSVAMLSMAGRAVALRHAAIAHNRLS